MMTDNEFDRYITLYRRHVRNAAMCIVKNAADADDIAQDVFLKLYTREEYFTDDEHVKAWLIRAAVNSGIDHLRSQSRRSSVSLSDVGELAAPEKSESVVMPAIMRLDGKLRITLYLHYYEGYTVEETARILKISRSTVKLRLRNGREKLKALIEGGLE